MSAVVRMDDGRATDGAQFRRHLSMHRNALTFYRGRPLPKDQGEGAGHVHFRRAKQLVIHAAALCCTSTDTIGLRGTTLSTEPELALNQAKNPAVRRDSVV